MRQIKWIKAAKRDFCAFPERVQEDVATALQTALVGRMADSCKPMKGLGAGVLEVRVSYRQNAYRTVYAVKLGADIYVVHAFQKRSTSGIKTPKKEIDLIAARIKQIKETLK